MSRSSNIKARFDDQLSERWRAMLDARKLTQQDAITALAEWVLTQDSLVQAIVFGQVEERDHAALLKLVLKRLADKPTASRKGK